MTPAKGTAGVGVLCGLVLGYQSAGIGGALLFAPALGAGGYLAGAVVDGGFRLFDLVIATAVESALRVWPLLLAVAALALVGLLTWGLRL
jgi:hypothetical protein